MKKVKLTPPVKPELYGDAMTRRGKNVTVVPNGAFALFSIVMNEGGQLPEMLRGSYTTREDALKDINKWLQTRVGV